MKKILAALLVGIMILALAGCSDSKPSKSNFNNYTTNAKPRKFKDTLEFSLENYSCSTVEGNTVHYKVYYGFVNRFVDFSFPSDESLTNYIKRLLQSYEDLSAARSLTGIILLPPDIDGIEYEQLENKEYDLQKGQIKSNGGVCVEFFQDNTIKHGNDIYKRDDGFKELSAAFNEAMIEIYTEKYGKLATYKDVKYDPLSYLNKYFTVSGTVELDDYYNYDYRDLESVYFCICITPTGGGYTDRWYIYCDRGKYKNLLESLKNNEKFEITTKLTIVCKSGYPDSLKEEMANLVDYFEIS